MGVVRLRGPLKTLAGGRGEHELEGATVVEILTMLEDGHPALSGWILDERGLVRRHINVFVNGERGQEGTAVAPKDCMEIVPAITGVESVEGGGRDEEGVVHPRWRSRDGGLRDHDPRIRRGAGRLRHARAALAAVARSHHLPL